VTTKANSHTRTRKKKRKKKNKKQKTKKQNNGASDAVQKSVTVHSKKEEK